jgi:hypothetical protein
MLCGTSWNAGRNGMQVKTTIINLAKKEWPKHLFEVRQVVEAVDELEFVGKKFNIHFGEIVLTKTNSHL